MDPYLAFAVQADVAAPTASTDPADTWRSNLERIDRLVAAAARRHGPPRLVVLPAYAVTGLPEAVTPETTTPIPCDAFTVLPGLARRYGAFIAASALEGQRDRPDHWWHSAFLVDPHGEVLLTYRQLFAATQPGLAGATAVEASLEEAIPVADTAIGRIALCLGMDALSPEWFRAAAFHGAEIVCLSTDEPPSFYQSGARTARLARAWEGTLSLVVADHAHGGTSEIVGWDARVQAAAGGPGETVVAGWIDVDHQRTIRSLPRSQNFLLGLRTPLYVKRWERVAAAGLPETPAEQDVAPFGVAALQTALHHIPDLRQRDEGIRRNLDRSIELLEWAGVTARIVVFPEFWLQGYERNYTFDDFYHLAMTTESPEFARLRDAAARYGIYLCGSIWEKDRDWPDRVFNTVFLLDPRGELVARHHKVNCLNLAGALADTTPGDVWTAYCERYGDDYLFPVVDTPYGRVGLISSFEIHYPEQARQLALGGAEIILHSSAEVNGAFRHAWQAARQTRAFENCAYLVSANIGVDYAPATPELLQHGHSQVIDYNGQVIAIVDGAGEALLTAQLDISALRRRRARLPNPVRDAPAHLWTALYRDHQGCPVDLFLKEPFKDKQLGPQHLQRNLERLYERGIFVRPKIQHGIPSKAY